MVTVRKWDNKLKCKRAAEYLVTKLKAMGFTVMRYDSYTSNSIYLKLDEGVTGTIRISDHRGKKHLQYRYNLLTGQKNLEQETSSRGVEQFYIPMHYIDQLISKVIYDRQERIDKYGIVNYNLYRQRNKQEGLRKDGFWRKAKYV